MHLLALLYTLLIIGLHLLPSGGDLALNEMSLGPFRADYLLHFALFLPWMSLMLIRMERWRIVRRELGFKLWVGWLLLGLGLAVAAELIHYWLPGRTFNPMDAMCNAAGVVFGAVVVGGVRLARGNGII